MTPARDTKKARGEADQGFTDPLSGDNYTANLSKTPLSSNQRPFTASRFQNNNKENQPQTTRYPVGSQGSPKKAGRGPGAKNMPARSYSMENDANASFIRQMQRLGAPTPRPAKTTSPAAKSDSHTSNDGIYPLVRPCQGEKAKLRGESKQDYDRTMTSFERQMQKLREQQAKEKGATMLGDDEQEL